MAKLNETIVLNYYLNEIENNNISFLKNKKECAKKIKNKIIELRDEKSMNKKIIFAKELWKQLFESSMSYIDPDKRGYDRLFAYFDEYVNFEELIFASDSFYRDHTLHSLWVYFLGEYIIRQEEFKRIKTDRICFNNLSKQLILDYCERIELHGSSIATRNQRLTAIHALFRYIQSESPEHAA